MPDSKYPLPHHSTPEARAKRIAERKKTPPNPENVARFLRALNGRHPKADAAEDEQSEK